MEHERAVQNLAVECYLLGEMTAEQREQFESHYFECAVCADDLREASQFIEYTKDILASEKLQPISLRPAVERPRASGWFQWLQPQFAMAAIAVLVVVAGVESLSTIPGLERRLAETSSPRIVSPTYLKDQTRGEPPTLKLVSGAPAVFIFDLPESSPTNLEFVVKSTDGHTVLQIIGKAPGGSDPATLSIPKLDLPEGSYALVVEAAGASGQPPLGSYPFEVKR